MPAVPSCLFRLPCASCPLGSLQASRYISTLFPHVRLCGFSAGLRQLCMAPFAAAHTWHVACMQAAGKGYHEGCYLKGINKALRVVRMSKSMGSRFHQHKAGGGVF